MARIICISKYPPLEGGIAAKTYWMCGALAKRGHTVHVVTDGENGDTDYCSPAFQDQASAKNLHIHRPQEKIPWHIPNDPHRSLALLNAALEVVDRHGADIIDTGYLIPYGLVGCLAGQMTGIPYLLRHGGSDLNKFVDKGIWPSLIKKAFSGAGALITDNDHCGVFGGLLKRIVSIPPYVPDPAFFRPESGGKSKPTLALIGKANYHWRHKGWHRAVEIIKSLGDRFHYLIVSQGIGLKDFRKYTEERVDSGIEWKEFVHPVEMPRLLQSISGIFALQQDLPFTTFSNLVMEALYCNVSVITDRSDMIQSLNNQGLNISAESRHVLVIPNDEPASAAGMIINFFGRSAPEHTDIRHRQADYTTYLGKNLDVILSAIEKG